MITEKNTTLKDLQDAKRWIIIMSTTNLIDEGSKRIVLNRFLLEDSLQQLVKWANTPPRKHGKFYLYDLTKKQKELCEQYLDDKFVLVDATLDPGLEILALPVNTAWDGISDTVLPIIPTGDEQLYYASEAQLTQAINHDGKAIEFYNGLNRWLEEVRSSGKGDTS